MEQGLHSVHTYTHAQLNPVSMLESSGFRLGGPFSWKKQANGRNSKDARVKPLCQRISPLDHDSLDPYPPGF